MITRREVLAGALAVSAAGLAGLTGCGLAGRGTVDSRGDSGESGTHPALRRPRAHGVVALLMAAGDAGAVLGAARELHRRTGAEAMVGFSSAFFDATGLSTRRPDALQPMPEFPGDLPMPERGNAAVLVQVEGDSAEAVGRRADAVLGGLPGLALSWRTPVSRSVAGVEQGRALQRNPFGFVEGQGNPALATEAADRVLLGPTSSPQWTVGGSYLALRVIRLALHAWDADSVEKQQRIIGRRADGRWLDGTPAFVEPPFAADPDGAVTPLDSHVRRVNPRTPGEPEPRMLRRSWTYRGGVAAGGVPDEGMVFMAFQNDLASGFVRAQQRLHGEALTPYLLTVGGGYFLVPTESGRGALLDI